MCRLTCSAMVFAIAATARTGRVVVARPLEWYEAAAAEETAESRRKGEELYTTYSTEGQAAIEEAANWYRRNKQRLQQLKCLRGGGEAKGHNTRGADKGVKHAPGPQRPLEALSYRRSREDQSLG